MKSNSPTQSSIDSHKNMQNPLLSKKVLAETNVRVNIMFLITIIFAMIVFVYKTTSVYNQIKYDIELVKEINLQMVDKLERVDIETRILLKQIDELEKKQIDQENQLKTLKLLETTKKEVGS